MSLGAGGTIDGRILTNQRDPDVTENTADQRQQQHSAATDAVGKGAVGNRHDEA